MTPLISCLCITRGRVEMLRNAVSLFEAQTYPHRELVIIYESDDQPTVDYLGHSHDARIRPIMVSADKRLPLGALRNLAVEQSAGEYFCQWDDDDWHHPRRLELQYRVVEESHMPASVLLHWIIFDATSHKAYLSVRRPWEGSLMCKKSLIDGEIRYQDMPLGEDTIVVKKLFAKHLVFPVMMPKLYIYVFHGKNVWSAEHWQDIFKASVSFSDQSSLLIKEIVNGKHDPLAAAALLDDARLS